MTCPSTERSSHETVRPCRGVALLRGSCDGRSGNRRTRGDNAVHTETRYQHSNTKPCTVKLPRQLLGGGGHSCHNSNPSANFITTTSTFKNENQKKRRLLCLQLFLRVRHCVQSRLNFPPVTSKRNLLHLLELGTTIICILFSLTIIELQNNKNKFGLDIYEKFFQWPRFGRVPATVCRYRRLYITNRALLVQQGKKPVRIITSVLMFLDKFFPFRMHHI